MRFFFSPIIFLFELIGFVIQAAVAYGILLILVFGFIMYGISTMPKEPERIVEYVNIEPERSGSVCKRISGCKTFPNAKTEEEYCPTCDNVKTSFSSSIENHKISKEPLPQAPVSE